MLKEKLKITNKNYLKMNILFLALIISNIIFFIGLVQYHSNIGIKFDLGAIEDFAIAIATISILGYVSGRLPKIKGFGDSAIYGIVYSIIICIIALMSSYFNANSDTSLLFGPYLDIFGILCGVLIFVLLATKLKSFKAILDGEFTRKNQIVCLIVFLMVGLFATYACVRVNGTPVNIRCLIVMISGLFGGPFVGIPVGIITGAHIFSLGGSTAVPCAISTVISGVVGSLVFVWNDKKFPNFIPATVLIFLFIGFDMLLVVLLTPPDISFPFIQDIYPLLVFASVCGMILFSIVIKEAKEEDNVETQISAEKQKIKEIEIELKEYDEKIEKLENEIAQLKKVKEEN